MLNEILMCIALFTPSAAVVDNEAQEEPAGEAEKDLCNDIGFDQWKCSLAPQCFWDTSDQRCEWIQDPSFCAQIFNAATCQSLPNCFWDTSDQRCERLI